MQHLPLRLLSVPRGGGIYLPQPHQSLAAYAANSPHMVDSFEVFWPGSDERGEKEAEAASLTRLKNQVFAYVCTMHMSLPMSLYRARVPRSHATALSLVALSVVSNRPCAY